MYTVQDHDTGELEKHTLNSSTDCYFNFLKKSGFSYTMYDSTVRRIVAPTAIIQQYSNTEKENWKHGIIPSNYLQLTDFQELLF